MKLLKLVAQEIGRLNNNIMIEGYTDARPYVGKDYSNWELSTDRANTARRILEENGVKRDQILQVRGFSDRNLKHPDKPMDSANRRVSILVAATPEQVAQDVAPQKPQVVPQKPEVTTQNPQIAPEINKK